MMLKLRTAIDNMHMKYSHIPILALAKNDDKNLFLWIPLTLNIFTEGTSPAKDHRESQDRIVNIFERNSQRESPYYLRKIFEKAKATSYESLSKFRHVLNHFVRPSDSYTRRSYPEMNQKSKS